MAINVLYSLNQIFIVFLFSVIAEKHVPEEYPSTFE